MLVIVCPFDVISMAEGSDTLLAVGIFVSVCTLNASRDVVNAFSTLRGEGESFDVVHFLSFV